MSCLKKIDYLGKEFRFKIDGGEFKTKLGGLVTITLVGILCFLTWYFGGDILYHVEPIMLIDYTILSEYPTTPVNYTNFFYAMKLDDDFGNTFDKRFFTYHTAYTSYYFDNQNQQWVNRPNETYTLDQEICSTKNIDNYLDNHYIHRSNTRYNGIT